MKTAAIVLCVLFFPLIAGAATYDLHVTRVSQDVYKVDGGATVYIKTAYCYEYATGEEAVLVLNMQPFNGSIDIGKLVFINSGTSCQVDTILQ